MSANDKVRMALRRLIDDRGIDMATVSRAIGKNHAYIQQYLTRGVPSELSYRTAMALADYFGCGVDTFGIGDAPASVPRPSSDGHKGHNGHARHPMESIRRLVGLDTGAFATALGCREADIVAVEAGHAPLNEKLLLKICLTFDIEPEDLAAYNTPVLSPEERVMLLRFRQLTPQQRRSLDQVFRKFEKERV